MNTSLFFAKSYNLALNWKELKYSAHVDHFWWYLYASFLQLENISPQKSIKTNFLPLGSVEEKKIHTALEQYEGEKLVLILGELLF